MSSAKIHYIKIYFEDLEHALARAVKLSSSNEYHLEGITILLCHIAAISRSRYPTLKDWAAFKEIIKNYSDKYDLFENIDLLLFYQWPHSKLSEDKIYHQLAQYEEIVSVFEQAIGNEETIRETPQRYQKRKDLLDILSAQKISGFDQDNFEKHIELFSNNQILYEFARCEAVHNHQFPLVNIGFTFPDMQRTFTPNHQITCEVIVASLTGIIANLKAECITKEKWPRQL